VILPAVACQLRVETRRIPPAPDAGGDIHDALVTPFGVRVLVGDVMGTGLPANETGSQVVAAWRELAVAEPSLPGIAVRLHALIARSENPERFVTALLANFGCHVTGSTGSCGGHGGSSPRSGSSLDLVCCGHPPPLLLRGESASFVETFPAPPLGLLDLADGWCTKSTMPFGAGDRLLLYTDGVSEARDTAGRYFPLSERAADALRGEPDVYLLDGLVASVRAHIGKRQADDILLLLATR
jgi:serine phosphatase RsbU (regulator of sigma subunit)